jgi:hypothetical protein
MKHFQYNLNAKAVAWLHVALLVFASFMPFLLRAQPVYADAIVDSRSITLETSEGAAAGVIYTVDFTTDNQGTIQLEWIVIEFCSNSPIIGETCTAPAGLDINEAALTINNEVGIDTDFTVDQASSDANTLILTDASPTTTPLNDSTTVSFDLGASGTTDGIDNPTNDNETFYARILLYDDDTDDQGSAYTDTAPGDRTYDGGIALSTAQPITVSARVQEVLTFCVGTHITTVGDCSSISGSSIDLGVLDTTTPTQSADLDTVTATADTCDYAAGDDAECAIMVVTTNATADGVLIQYVATAFDVADVCTPAGSPANDTDQCLNNAATETVIGSGTEGVENWGLAVRAQENHANTQVALEDQLVIALDYDYDAADEFAVVDTFTATTLADTNGEATPAERVTDREQLAVEFAASPGFTTPSGAYDAKLVFIATGTF